MAKLLGVEVNLGPEMKSTGEVMGVDHAFEPAFYKALISAGIGDQAASGSILISLADEDKADSLRRGPGTGPARLQALCDRGHRRLDPARRDAGPARHEAHRQGQTGRARRDPRPVVDGVINTPGPADKEILDGLEIRRAAVERGIPCVTSIDTARAMVTAMSQATSAYSVQTLADYRRVGRGY